MTPISRALLSPGLPLALLAALGVSVLGSALLTSDTADTVLGAVAGACSVLLLFALGVQLADRRARRAEREQEALDGLEPLRAARRDGAPRS